MGGGSLIFVIRWGGFPIFVIKSGGASLIFGIMCGVGLGGLLFLEWVMESSLKIPPPQAYPTAGLLIVITFFANKSTKIDFTLLHQVL